MLPDSSTYIQAPFSELMVMMMMMLIIRNKVYGNVDIKDHGTDVCFSENFLDIDECSTNSHSCHINATCSNMQGSYKCACKAGYLGNGKTCTGKRLPLSVYLIINIYIECNFSH